MPATLPAPLALPPPAALGTSAPPLTLPLPAVWPTLPPVVQRQIRRTVLQVLQEVLHDA